MTRYILDGGLTLWQRLRGLWRRLRQKPEARFSVSPDWRYDPRHWPPGVTEAGFDLTFTGVHCRVARAMLGLSQAQLADAAHISVGTIGRYEAVGSGVTGMTYAHLRSALEAAGASFGPNYEVRDARRRA